MTTKLIRLPGSDRDLMFICGPYRERVQGTFGIKLAPEVAGECDLLVRIPDFGVPTNEVFEDALATAIRAAEDGAVVYVGCMGGIGRTGTFLAGLCRVLRKKGGDESVAWVRANYLTHAVETRKQEELVSSFSAAMVRGLVRNGGDRGVATSFISRYLQRAFNFGNARRQAGVDTRSS